MNSIIIPPFKDKFESEIKGFFVELEGNILNKIPNFLEYFKFNFSKNFIFFEPLKRSEPRKQFPRGSLIDFNDEYFDKIQNLVNLEIELDQLKSLRLNRRIQIETICFEFFKKKKCWYLEIDDDNYKLTVTFKKIQIKIRHSFGSDKVEISDVLSECGVGTYRLSLQKIEDLYLELNEMKEEFERQTDDFIKSLPKYS